MSEARASTRKKATPPLDFRENLIVDQDNPILIQKAWRDHDVHGWAYLAVPHGEDALTWNVFRSLDVGGRLDIIQKFFGLDDPVEEVLFWGCDPDGRSDIQQQLNILIRGFDGQRKGTMTELDLLIVTRSEICAVECKLRCSNEPWAAQGTGWRRRWTDYHRVFPELLPEQPQDDPYRYIYQLMRNAIYAELLRKELGRRVSKVCALVSRERLSKVEGIEERYQAFVSHCKVAACAPLIYWEDLTDQVDSKVRSKLLTALAPAEVSAGRNGSGVR